MIGREVRKGPSAQAAGALANVGSAYIVDTRVNGGVEQIIAKTGQDDMLNEVLGALTKCIERRNKERLVTT